MFKNKTQQELFYQYQMAQTLEDLPEEVMQADFGHIQSHQLNDKSLTEKLKMISLTKCRLFMEQENTLS